MTLPAPPLPLPAVLVLMGVSGCGKTTVGVALARRLGWRFEEGDALHPPANVAKMAAGHALDDADRAPWLARVAARIDADLAAGRSGVVTCSALKRAYRARLRQGDDRVVFVWLDGPRALLAGRLDHRRGHFMPATLLDSQLATLEPPGADEPALRVEIGPPPAQLVETIVAALGLTG